MKKVYKAMLILMCSIAVFMSAKVDVEAHNKRYEDFGWLLVEDGGKNNGHEKDDDVTYYDSVKEVGSALRKGMKARKATIKVGFTTKKELDKSIIDEFMDEALKHTGVPTEGDYLRGHYKSYKASASGVYKNGIYNWVFTYTVKYRTTATQEKATDTAVADILDKLNLDGKDSYTKIKAIYDYICDNVEYDWAHVNNDSYTIKHTAYAAVVKKTAVCQGYSLLLYRMLLESDIDVRVISGTGNGEDHSWNIVEIDDLYYLVDVTWDSSLSSYKWFLKGESSFSNHKADSKFTKTSFTKKYPISDTQYSYDGEHTHEYKSSVTKATFTKSGKISRRCTVCGVYKKSESIPYVKTKKLAYTAVTYSGKVRTPAVTVKDKEGKVLVQGKDYTLSYSSGRKYVGKYSVKITLKGNYSGTKTLYFTIRPKETKISSLKAGSKSFTVNYTKCTTQTSGYQIQYSTSSKFSSAKSVLVKKNTTVSEKISGLKTKKTYYVRVRTYKTVKINGKYTKIYSAWSAVKSVKTKS